MCLCVCVCVCVCGGVGWRVEEGERRWRGSGELNRPLSVTVILASIVMKFGIVIDRAKIS